MSLLGKEKPHPSEKNSQRESQFLMRLRKGALGQGSEAGKSKGCLQAPAVW